MLVIGDLVADTSVPLTAASLLCISLQDPTVMAEIEPIPADASFAFQLRLGVALRFNNWQVFHSYTLDVPELTAVSAERLDEDVGFPRDATHPLETFVQTCHLASFILRRALL